MRLTLLLVAVLVSAAVALPHSLRGRGGENGRRGGNRGRTDEGKGGPIHQPSNGDNAEDNDMEEVLKTCEKVIERCEEQPSEKRKRIEGGDIDKEVCMFLAKTVMDELINDNSEVAQELKENMAGCKQMAESCTQQPAGLVARLLHRRTLGFEADKCESGLKAIRKLTDDYSIDLEDEIDESSSEDEDEEIVDISAVIENSDGSGDKEDEGLTKLLEMVMKAYRKK